MGLNRALVVALALALAAPACDTGDVVSAPGCLGDTLAAYRNVVGRAAEGRFDEFRDAAREAAETTAACAEEAVDECRDALGDLASSLRDAASDVTRPSAFREHRTRLEGAAAAAAACAREVL